MQPGAIVLLTGSLDDPSWWFPVSDELERSGRMVIMPPTEDRPPYGNSWVASSAEALHRACVTTPLVLVGRGTTGPLLPALARTQRAAGRHVAAYVFVDATLARPGRSSHLDILRAADDSAADAAHERLHTPGEQWPDGAARPRDHDFWTTPLPMAVDWPDAPCAYVQSGDVPAGVGDVDFWRRSARARGWLVLQGTDVALLIQNAIAALPG